MAPIISNAGGGMGTGPSHWKKKKSPSFPKMLINHLYIFQKKMGKELGPPPLPLFLMMHIQKSSTNTMSKKEDALLCIH